MIRTQVVKLYPNQTMYKYLDKLCDYRRYCWNQGLETWNDMYEESLIMDNKKLKPTTYKVRKEMTVSKEDWQYQLSSRCLYQAIEDLDVKQMQMTHVASKGLQRSLFGKFRQYLTYKCKWYGKNLILADKYYPSTQRCSSCGYIKKNDERITLQGNLKHHTKHNEYICYQCGAVMNRDENAVQNLLALA